jgi:hypothetical protein
MHRSSVFLPVHCPACTSSAALQVSCHVLLGFPDQTTAPMFQDQTQALAPPDVPIAPSELTATGAISKTPVIPLPELAPSPRHPDRVVTRSETNAGTFVQSVKKKFGDRSFSK